MNFFAKQYSRAIHSSNLKSDEYHTDTDKLAAAAHSGDLGSLLFRVKYANDATTYSTLLTKWMEIVTKKCAMREWPKHVSALKVAAASLDYWLNDVCPVCSGKCYKPVPNVPTVLSDTVCQACLGQGKKPLVFESRSRDYVADMIEELDDLARSAAQIAMRKLASEMDL